MADIELRIKQFVVDNFLFGGCVDEIPVDSSFMGTGMIDSLGVLELIAFAEEHFGVVVADEDVVPANFDSVAQLARYIHAKQSLAVLA